MPRSGGQPLDGPILILGGTAEARELANALVASGERVVSSLAGRVSQPRLPAGEVRIGGFGGAAGLARWLKTHGVRAVVDATHPFAASISRHAVAACRDAGVPLIRIERPPWRPQPGDRWHYVPDVPSAADLVPKLAERVFLTIGRQQLAAFASVDRCWFLIRCVEQPNAPLPARHQLLLDRGPFTFEGELTLLDEHAIELLVTKESGGPQTEAKLAAARARGLPVVVIRRPPRPPAESVSNAQEALSWLTQLGACGAP
ncbi:cobalt-precorrin-6A reductase [Thermoleophilum album]|uniref:Precorrin-6A/cobalt-precorrin-6A reductase n=1 Tax=Thermoleophilum album TaxID=29539 RepID=A0A1H6FSW4_THEAL|nr:cobalt-precorrin-6A reductase [Thermoleophilum album]SEH12855.1 precorrin-6A/cobalt-precorrin-6A reductase [Thermoleophilum album]